MKTYALVTAAGSGKRFGGRQAKQYVEIDGKPLLYYCLRPFAMHDAIQGIVLVVRQDDLKTAEDWLSDWRMPKVQKIIPGGVERQDSVAAGLSALPEDATHVLVHDGSRPCLPSTLIDRLLAEGSEGKAVIPALPVRETIKRVDTEKWVERTENRSHLWLTQTPQLYQLGLLQRAIESAMSEKFYGTDEAMLVERLGEQVKVVEGDPWNIKVTYPRDLELVSAWFRRGEDTQ